MYYEEWLQSINRADLLGKNQAVVRVSNWVCDAHFREDQKVPGSRLKSNLKKDAIPVLGENELHDAIGNCMVYNVN